MKYWEESDAGNGDNAGNHLKPTGIKNGYGIGIAARSAFWQSAGYRQEMDMKIVLASASPRRIQLLQQIGLTAKVQPCTLPENVTSTKPQVVVAQLSEQKAQAIAKELFDNPCAAMVKQKTDAPEREREAASAGTEEKHPETEETKTKAEAMRPEEEATVVIGADTVVAVDDKILGKPGSHEEAYRMIESLQGRTHQVYTGVTVIGKDRRTTFVEVSEVMVAPMTPEEIREYADSEEPMDKAGAYGIQGTFGRYVTGIRGDYNNIVGLPVAHLYRVLKEMGL